MTARAALYLIVWLPACASPNAVQCSDGRVCPAGTECDDERQLCITDQQVAACTGVDDGYPCTFGASVGVCDRGVCVPASCGNGDVGPGEACDDGNLESGDGCRADCAKIETCGDQFVDDGEACDDGNTNPVDGCDACTTTAWTPTVLLGGASAATTALMYPAAVDVDSRGAVYVADSSRRQVLRIENNIVSLIAGTGEPGYGGDGGPAVSSVLENPAAIAVDNSGNVFIADRTQHRVRRIDRDGIISTVAGTGIGGYDAGYSGPATGARINGPEGLAVDGLGNLFIADTQNHVVRRVDATSGVITTVAGTGTYGAGGEDLVATASQLYSPRGLDVGPTGELFIVDSNNNRIRRVDAGGSIRTIAGSGVQGYAGDGGIATSARLYVPTDVSVDSDGGVYIADQLNQRIRRVSPQGVISTVFGTGTFGASGDGGAPTSALLAAPVSVAVSDSGAVYVAEGGTLRVRQASNNVTSTLIGSAEGAGKLGVSLDELFGIAIDGQGRIYVALKDASRIVRIELDGRVSTFAGTGIPGYAGDGGPATAATLQEPGQLMFDAGGNLFVIDRFNNVVRRISTSGTITTIAGDGTAGYSGDNGPATSAQLDQPASLAFDASGSLYIADTNNDRIRKISGGTITTVVGTSAGGFSGDGGPATAAQLDAPETIVFDAQGNLYIADSLNHRVRQVTSGGTITTVAGNGSSGTTGDGGPATSAQVGAPHTLAIDTQGRLVIGSLATQRVRRVENGTISALGGKVTLKGRLDGDGGPALTATMRPRQFVTTSAGLVFGDGTGLVRLLENSGRVLAIAGKVDPEGVGPIAQARLADPRALVVEPTFTLFAGGASGTVQQLSGTTLSGVIGRYPNIAGTENLARFRDSRFPRVGGVAYDPTANAIYLTASHSVFAVTLVNPSDPTTWTIAPLANGQDAPGYANGAADIARFTAPTALYLDRAARQLFVADTGNQVIRKIDLSANTPAVTTIAGTPLVRGFGGDGGNATAAVFHTPQALARCPNGDLFIADTGNNRVRRLGTTVSTVLGDGTASSSGDGAPATSYTVDTPLGVACDSLGNVYVTSSKAVRLLPANAAGVVDGAGGVQTIYGRAPRDTFPASVTSCLTAIVVVEPATLRVTDACTGMLVELHRAPVGL